MYRQKSFIPYILFLIGALVMAACSVINNADDGPEVVRVIETVEVTRIVQVTADSSASETDDQQSGSSDVVEVVVTATPFPTMTPTVFPTGVPGEFTEEDLDKLWDVWQLIEEDYYGPIPQDEVITDAMITAMVATLGDRHTNYFTPDVAERIRDGFEGDFTGIGAYVDTNEEGYFYIVRPIRDTPAEKAGLKPNDIVIEVDGQSIFGMVTDEVVAIVRGPEKEPVVLTIVREGVADPFDVTIIRDRIIVPQVEAKIVGDGSIGYVRLESFNQLATSQLSAAIDAMINAGIEGLIFDLRDNGGGLLTQAVSVGDLFLPAGDFLIVKDNLGEIEEYKTEIDGQPAEEIPLVLLINGNSASASEIIAGAFRDYDRATLIGENTFGKGSVQVPHNLSDGSEFRVTIARFYSPLDIEINGVGVAPDIEFAYTPDILGDIDDKTLDRAIEFLKTGK